MISNPKKLVMVALVPVVVVFAYLSYNDAQQGSYEQTSVVSNGYSKAMTLMVAANVYVAETGKLPVTINDLNPIQSISIHSDYGIKGVTVLSDGTIKVTYDENSGVDNGSIELVPDFKPLTNTVDWSCISSSYQWISEVLINCRFQSKS